MPPWWGGVGGTGTLPRAAPQARQNFAVSSLLVPQALQNIARSPGRVQQSSDRQECNIARVRFSLPQSTSLPEVPGTDCSHCRRECGESRLRRRRKPLSRHPAPRTRLTSAATAASNSGRAHTRAVAITRSDATSQARASHVLETGACGAITVPPLIAGVLGAWPGARGMGQRRPAHHVNRARHWMLTFVQHHLRPPTGQETSRSPCLRVPFSSSSFPPGSPPRYTLMSRSMTAIVSAIDPVMLLHFRDDLRIGQLVRGLDCDSIIRPRV